MASEADERWKSIPGHPFYEASNLGRIRSVTRMVKGKRGLRNAPGRILQSADCHGYRSVVLCDEGGGHSHKVSWLIAAAFVGPCPDGMEVSHWNGDRTDDAFDNLVYETRAENNHHKFEHGTMVVGSRHARSKLTEQNVIMIRQSRETQRTLAAIYGVDQSIICKIKKGMRWRHVN
jgi:hypothetical protein